MASSQMVRLIQGVLRMSAQKTSKDLPSATFSQELEDGQEPCKLQDGVQTDLFGQEAPHVSLSPQQEKVLEKMMSDTSGQYSLISLESAVLKLSLVNRLQQLSDMDGSTIYKTTLKQKATPQQRLYYHLAASARTTKGTDSSSPQSAWLTPTTSDMNGVRELDGKRSGELNTQAKSAWPTPVSTDNRDRGKWDDPAIQRRVALKKSIELSMLVGSAAPYRHATKSPWPTPAARDFKGTSGSGRQEKKSHPSDTVPNAAATVPWATPTATDHSRGTKPPRPQDTGIPLTQQAGIRAETVGNSEHNGSHETEIGRSTGPGKAEGGMLELERSDSLFWGSSEVIYCRDGKYRPIPTEPALFPLADGIPNRVGLLRGAGNAIVPQAAAEIIKAYIA